MTRGSRSSPPYPLAGAGGETQLGPAPAFFVREHNASGGWLVCGPPEGRQTASTVSPAHTVSVRASDSGVTATSEDPLEEPESKLIGEASREADRARPSAL